MTHKSANSIYRNKKFLKKLPWSWLNPANSKELPYGLDGPKFML